jgi:hypothetical protein
MNQKVNTSAARKLFLPHSLTDTATDYTLDRRNCAVAEFSICHALSGVTRSTAWNRSESLSAFAFALLLLTTRHSAEGKD